MLGLPQAGWHAAKLVRVATRKINLPSQPIAAFDVWSVHQPLSGCQGHIEPQKEDPKIMI